jgi:hypothetical protein
MFLCFSQIHNNTSCKLSQQLLFRPSAQIVLFPLGLFVRYGNQPDNRKDEKMKNTPAPEWSAQLVGRMHVERITAAELSEELGCSTGYLSMILNGRRTPKDAKERLNKALDNILESRNG